LTPLSRAGLVKPCKTCGTEFTPGSSSHRYCSPGCRESEQPGYKQQKHIERVGRPLRPRGAKPDLAKRKKVAELRAAGWTLARIAAEMGVTPPAVSMLLKKVKAERPSDAAPDEVKPKGKGRK
jgi:DNA-binding CsgD family transcriptional regulator